jgi:hypothetical protein
MVSADYWKRSEVSEGRSTMRSDRQYNDFAATSCFAGPVFTAFSSRSTTLSISASITQRTEELTQQEGRPVCIMQPRRFRVAK